MAKAKATADTSLCKGCRLCVGVCPVKAIEPLTEINKKDTRSSESMKKPVSDADSAIRSVPIMYLPLSRRRQRR